MQREGTALWSHNSASPNPCQVLDAPRSEGFLVLQDCGMSISLPGAHLEIKGLRASRRMAERQVETGDVNVSEQERETRHSVPTNFLKAPSCAFFLDF